LDAALACCARGISHPIAWSLLGGVWCAWAWSDIGTLALLCLLPAWWSLAPRPVDAFAFVFGSVAWDSVALLHGAWNFAPSVADWGLAASAWTLSCLTIAGLWAGCHALLRRGPSIGCAALLAVQVLLLLPPLWLLGFFHSVVGWGDLLPGWGLSGLVIGLLVSVVVAWMCRQARAQRRSRGVACAVLCTVALVLAGLRPGQDSTSRPAAPPEVEAVQLRWAPLGRLDWRTAVDRPAEIARVVSQARVSNPDLSVLVLPEGVLGELAQRARLVFELEVVAAARAARLELLLGAEFSRAGKLHAGVLIVRPDGAESWLPARQPMPVLLWRPWRGGGPAARWDQRPVVDLASGHRVYLSQCFEDVLPGFFVMGMHGSGRRPDLVVSVANGWWMPTQRLQQRQHRAIAAMARLYGLPMVRAVNRAPMP
jgi:hypothetical protein